jgi:hypothetical protein
MGGRLLRTFGAMRFSLAFAFLAFGPSPSSFRMSCIGTSLLLLICDCLLVFRERGRWYASCRPHPRVVRAVAVDSRRDARAKAACDEGWLDPAASGGNGGRRRGRHPRARRPQARRGEAACRRCLGRGRVIDEAPDATRRPRERRRGVTSAPKPASGAPGGRQSGVRARDIGRRR